MEITTTEVKARLTLTFCAQTGRRGRQREREKGTKQSPLEDRPVSRCFYSVMALVVLEDDLMKYLPELFLNKIFFDA